MNNQLQRWTDHKDVKKIMKHAWEWFRDPIRLRMLGKPRTYILCQVICGSKYPHDRRGVGLQFAFIRSIPILEQVCEFLDFFMFSLQT